MTIGRLGALVLAGVAPLVGCDASSTAPHGSEPSELSIVERSEWDATFDELGVDGTFALHRIGSDRVLVHDPERAATRRIPASTFKVLNSLVALDAGVVGDVDEVVDWDGEDRGIESWNRDHSLRTAIEVSAVWVYQHVAREVGPARMERAVGDVGYGNADIGGPIDEFWLRGDLRISPLEQLDFLADLVTDDLPFSVEDQASVREILVRETGDGWTWAHKTGTALSARPVLGWLVGYTTTAGDSWVFAMNLDLGDATDAGSQVDPQLRITLSRRLLESAGALPAT